MLFMIAVIKNTKNDKDVLGYRILDTLRISDPKAKLTADVPVASIASNLGKGVVIENLALKDGAVVTTNGVASRYATINTNNEIIDKASLVVLYRIDEGFIVADYLGHVTKISNDEAVRLNDRLTIANGKVVEKAGKKFISSISGEYPYLEAKKAPQKVVETKFITITDADSVADSFAKVEDHINNPSKKLIGKLNHENSDRLIKHTTNHFKLVELIGSKDNAGAAKAIETVVAKYMPVLSRICEKKAVLENVKGLKAVYADLHGGRTDLIDAAYNKMQNDKVNMNNL